MTRGVSMTNNPARIEWIPFATPPLAALADHLIRCLTSGADLTDHTIILSDLRIGIPLRRHLIEQAQQQGHHALLGPQMLTLDKWLAPFLPARQRICPEQRRLLILVEALLDQPALLGAANPWALAENLLQLFDELTLNRIELGNDQNQFIQQIATWYQLSHTQLHGLTQEAELVLQLWLAWHTQLHASLMIDQRAARIAAFNNSLEAMPNKQTLHLVGMEFRHRAEQHWLTALRQKSNVVIWLHGNVTTSTPASLISQNMQDWCTELGISPASAPPLSAYEAALVTILNPNAAPLHQRARAFVHHYPESPLRDRIITYAARDSEHEARAIDVQVRRWLLAGKQNIAIVTENRRLARRLRALLERAEIILEDSAGWALSTTRAAAALEALLECIEEDFAHTPLLDLCKSSFIFADLDDNQVSNAVYRLERDIIQHENIARGLQRYQRFITDRSERLSDIWLEQTQPAFLLSLLDRLNTGTQTLRRLLSGKHQPAYFISTLFTTLQQLGMFTALERDDAGSRLLSLLETLQTAAHEIHLKMNWLDFRGWLGRSLETVYFRPSDSGCPVQLLNLAQAQWQHFDAIIIASAEQDQLPGRAQASPFFNDSVRREMGLPTRQRLGQDQLRQFYRLLHSAPQILITYRREADGEWIAKTPWLEAIETFHQVAYDTTLHDAELDYLAQHTEVQVFRCDTPTLPELQTAPAPRAPTEFIPALLSYSDFQQLVNCPYQFFAARCLRLSPPEEVRLVLSKREYGQRVHQCLQAFHSNVENLPGPFNQPLTVARRADAIALMQQIAATVFARDVAENFTHRGWLHQWQQCVPAYIDWQIRREQTWKIHHVEQREQIPLTAQLQLKGRLDRLDMSLDGVGIVDYKTGNPPSKTDVLAGEEIQLAFYALLAQQPQQTVAQAEYLQINDDMASKVLIPGDMLTTLSEQLRQQIERTFNDMTQQQPLPAFAHEEVCNKCDMEMLCRKQMWEEHL
jgi:ATP-dependent helicase/nuclease subunit B